VESPHSADGRPFVCRLCVNVTYTFDRVRSWSFYDGPVVRSILLLKFENIEPLGVLFARLLAEIVARRRSF
jgi:predicted amidophosphoribosyltransferase